MSARFRNGRKGDDREADWRKIICSSVGERGVLTTASFTQLWELGHRIAWQGWYEGGGRHGWLRVPLKGRKGQMRSACLVMYGREVSQGLLGYIDQASLRRHREEAHAEDGTASVGRGPIIVYSMVHRRDTEGTENGREGIDGEKRRQNKQGGI